MALITLLIIAEKMLPWGTASARAGAVVLVAYGALILAAPGMLPTFMDMGSTPSAQ
jgi:predicted metal-binding membrane protein